MSIHFNHRFYSFFPLAAAAFFAASFVILSGQLLLKPNLIFNTQPILDDITFYKQFLFDNIWYKRPDVLVFTLIVKYTGIFYGKAVYLLLFAMGAGTWALAIFALTRSALFAVLISVAALQSEYTFIYPIFMTASYGLLFFPFFGLSIFMMVWISGANQAPPTGVKLWLVVMLTVAATLVGSVLNPNAILVPLVMLTALGWLICRERGVRDSIVPLLGLALAGAAFYFYTLLTFHHPYADMEGRVTRDPLEVIKNALSLLKRTVWSAFDARISTGSLTADPNYALGFLIAGLLCVLLWACWKFRKDYVAVSFAILCAGLIAASLVPLSPLTRSHLWHFFLHGILLITVTGVLLRSLSTILGYVFVLGMIGFGIVTNLQAVPRYSAAYTQQEELARFIRQNESKWPDSARVIVFTDRRELRANGLADRSRSRSFFELETGRGMADFWLVIIPEADIKGSPEFQAVAPDRSLYKWYGVDSGPALIGGDL